MEIMLLGPVDVYHVRPILELEEPNLSFCHTDYRILIFYIRKLKASWIMLLLLLCLTFYILLALQI